MTEHSKCFYDDEGHFRGYFPLWHDWPLGENGHNIDYWSADAPICPECMSSLRMTEYVSPTMRLPRGYTPNKYDFVVVIYVCEECQTLYVGPYRTPQTIQEEPTPKKEEAVTPAKPLTISDKYRYLIG